MVALALVLGLLIDIPLIMLRGFVAAQLWRWFMVPLGLPAIGVAWAIGILLTIGLATARKHQDDDGRDRLTQAIEAIIYSLFVSLYTWGIGALVASFL